MSFFTWKDDGLTSDCTSLDAMASRFEETASLIKRLSQKGFILKKTQKNHNCNKTRPLSLANWSQWIQSCFSRK